MISKHFIFSACSLLFCLNIACSPPGDDAVAKEINRADSTSAEISGTVTQGQTLLHKAVIANDIELLQAVLAKGADLDAKDGGGCTALHLAVKIGRHEALKMLIDRGADIALPMPGGDSPLQFAVRHDDVVAAASLHLCRSNRDILLTKDSANRPLAIQAVKNKQYSIAELFIRPLHYIVKRDRPGYLPHLLEVEKRLLRQKDEKGMTPLHVAYLYQNRRFIELLITAGADERALDTYGRKPSAYGIDHCAAGREVCVLDEKTEIRIEDRMLDFLMHHDWMTIGIVQDGEIAFLKSYGRPGMIDRDAVHASVSKPMASIIFLRLLKEGAIKSLDDDIALYSKKYRNVLPAAFAKEKITFRHILTHTSGIPHLNKPLWLNGKLNLLFKPGDRFEYSSNAFSILGEIMTEVTGKTFSDLVKEHVGHPIGASSFWAENDFRAPAARIHSTTRDYLRFAMGIIDNRYMSEREFDDILVGKKSADSLGWGTAHIGTVDLTLGHSGSNGRPRSHLLIKPKKKIALVLMGETRSKDDDVWFVHLAPILMDILEGKGGY